MVIKYIYLYHISPVMVPEAAALPSSAGFVAEAAARFARPDPFRKHSTRRSKLPPERRWSFRPW